MKISIIGAGNVGGLTAMRLAQEGLGDIILVDITKGLAQGKAFDLEDARSIFKNNYSVFGTDNINEIKDSDIILITAGFTRQVGMTREELLNKNSKIIKDICTEVKKLASDSILIMVTNPLDLMTYLALKVTRFNPYRVLGMGITLDAARFTNLISQELKVPCAEIEACVMGSHGEGMLPLPRLTYIKGVSLDEFIDDKKIERLVKKTIERGKELISLLGCSAYFAPSAAVASIVKAIVKDEKKILGISAYLNGEYGIKDICLGVPCRLGKNGIEQIIELDLNKKEKEAFLKSATSLKEQYNNISKDTPPFLNE